MKKEVELKKKKIKELNEKIKDMANQIDDVKQTYEKQILLINTTNGQKQIELSNEVNKLQKKIADAGSQEL